MKLSKNSIFYHETTRIILEFFIILAVLAMMLVLIFSAQLLGDSDSSEEDAQTIYNYLTEVLSEKSSTIIDNLVSVSFDQETSRLYVTARSDDQLIDFSLLTSSDSLIAYLPILLEEEFEEDAQFDCSILAINVDASLIQSSEIVNINYQVANYGLISRLSGTYLSADNVYTSIYQRDYDLETNTWG
ncbi:MAG: hypothetical protein WC201_03710, partial [Bacilli bacterium]